MSSKIASLCGLALILVAVATGVCAPNEFGTPSDSESALVGMFYDLKQTQKLEPTGMSPKEYMGTLGRFLKEGWSESVLDRYYRASRPLYTTQIFIPPMGANVAPEAFGVGHIVKPRLWLAHYKGQVIPPAAGKWRFWGMGDNILCVAVNGKIVLISNLQGARFPGVSWESPEPPGQLFGQQSRLIAGDWMEMSANEPFDLDVLIGEVPGGLFSSFLLVEKQGETYETANGHPVFPIFQLAPYDTPLPANPKTPHPRFARHGPIWKSVQ